MLRTGKEHLETLRDGRRYIFAPYGMWKHHRTQIASEGQPDRN
jgi:hypothetical protein